jgi:hypothetical protein
VINTITVQVGRSVEAFKAALLLATSVLVALALLGGLLLIDWKVALASAALFGSAYGLIGTTARRKLNRNSGLIAESSTQVLKAVQEEGQKLKGEFAEYKNRASRILQVSTGRSSLSLTPSL